MRVVSNVFSQWIFRPFCREQNGSRGTPEGFVPGMARNARCMVETKNTREPSHPVRNAGWERAAAGANNPAAAMSYCFGRIFEREEPMSVIGWIVFGLVAGAVARLLMPGRDPGGFFVTIVIGIVGAVIGGFIGSLLGLGTVDSFSAGSFALAVLGAVILLWGYRATRS